MTYGFTVVSPATLGVTDAWIERLRDAAVAAYETRNDVSIDFRTSTLTAAFDDPFFDEDEVFIEAATNPAKLALVRLMLGQGAVLRTNLIILKGPTADAPADDSALFHNLPLHVDQDVEGIPMGAGQICHRLNCTWSCTDQADEADGPTLFVPASQHFGHRVARREGPASSRRARPLAAHPDLRLPVRECRWVHSRLSRVRLRAQPAPPLTLNTSCRLACVRHVVSSDTAFRHASRLAAMTRFPERLPSVVSPPPRLDHRRARGSSRQFLEDLAAVFVQARCAEAVADRRIAQLGKGARVARVRPPSVDSSGWK